MDNLQILRRFALDVALWYACPAIFLAAYVHSYSAPASAIFPHLIVVTAPLALLIFVRLTLARLITIPLLLQLASTALVWSLFTLLLTYYALVIVGLNSWGGVVPWDVVPTFFAQAPQLLDVLGVPRLVAFTLLGVIYVSVAVLCWLYLKNSDWTAALAHKTSGAMLAVFVVGGLAILTIAAYRIATEPWTQVAEPVSLTLFPPNQELEGHVIDSLTARNVDKREDAARSAYVPAAAIAERKNLILIVVDALRPDHMGIFGYPRDTTPYLNRLAQRGIVRTVVAHASCGDTICGLLSLASSKFPREFSSHPFTLHQALKRNGYRIHLILSGDHSHFYSLKSYYGKVDTFFDGTQAQTYFLNDDQFLIDKVAAMPSFDGIPVMFQFHLMSAHVLRKREDFPGMFQPAHNYILQRAHDVGAAGVVVESAINFYDNGVRKADEVIHNLLEVLERKGYLRNTLVVITADHGESLGEHGLFKHANSVREQLLRIPFVLIAFGYRPKFPIDPRTFTSQVDIAPTIFAELGLPRPVTWTGQPLQEAATPDFTYFEEHYDMGLIDHRDMHNTWKYWINVKSGGQHAFNLETDPEETRDVLDSEQATLAGEWQVRALAGITPGSAAH